MQTRKQEIFDNLTNMSYLAPMIYKYDYFFYGISEVLTKRGGVSKTMSLLPNGNIAYSSRYDINIYDLKRRQIIATLKGHTKLLKSIKTLSNGDIVSLSQDYRIRLWDSLTFECYDILSSPRGYEIYDMVVLPDDRIAGCDYHDIIIWKSHDDFVTFGYEELFYTRIGILPNNRIITGNASVGTRIWDTESKECIKKIDNLVAMKNFLITKNKIIIAKPKGGLTVYDLEGNYIFGVRSLQNFEYFCDLDEDIIACGSNTGMIIIYNLKTRNIINTLDMSNHINISYGLNNKPSMIKLINGNIAIGLYKILVIYNPITDQIINSLRYDDIIVKVLALPNGKFMTLTRLGELFLLM